MSTYAKELHRHLAAYKASRLGVKEAGVFIHKGKEVRHGHILPKDLKWLNILEPFRAEVREFVEAHPEIRLHKYFHHLNSSQALALNLFFPLFEGGTSSRLLRALGIKGSVKRWQPELVPDANEGTNVDIAWQDQNDAWTYCEVKLSEQEFGLAKGDQRHHAKLADIYGPVLGPHCSAELLEPQRFFANYQILRNVWLAARETSSTVVFLLPSQNEALWRPLVEVKASLKPALAKRVHVAGMEHVLHELASDRSLQPRFAWYAELLAEKYVPSLDAT